MNRTKFIAVLAVIVCTITCNAKLYGLFVGIEDYEADMTKIYSCRADAEEMYRVYTNAKPHGRFVTLYDREATVQNLKANLRAQCRRAGAGDTIVLMLSGHGYRGGFCCSDFYLSSDTIRSILHGCKARRKIVIQMSCHSGSMAEVTPSKSTKIERFKREIKRKASLEQEVIVLTSSRPSQLSYGSYYSFSPFIANLSAALQGNADTNGDGKITLREVYDYLRAQNNYYGGQVPQMKGYFNENHSFL